VHPRVGFRHDQVHSWYDVALCAPSIVHPQNSPELTVGIPGVIHRYSIFARSWSVSTVSPTLARTSVNVPER
jgi:hypothetical protein